MSCFDRYRSLAMTPAAALRLSIDLDALAANWRWFGRTSGVDAGAAVKADGYGLGAMATVSRLRNEGCRTFYVATWAEAEALRPMLQDVSIRVLHGVDSADMSAALQCEAIPVLNSPAQLALWREQGSGRPCDVMVDTGMNRLGIDWRTFSIDMLSGLNVDTVHSHLACANDPESPMNAVQLRRFNALAAALSGVRFSIAGSGGVCLGREFALDHVRPGLGLYGGIPNPVAAGQLRQVVRPEARVVQLRDVPAGDTAGYGATWTAARDSRLAVLNVGYADGYLTGFSGCGAAIVDGMRCPVAGRVSMDLLIVDVTGAPALAEGEWVEIAYDLPEASAASGLSQYELLTGLGTRYERKYL